MSKRWVVGGVVVVLLGLAVAWCLWPRAQEASVAPAMAAEGERIVRYPAVAGPPGLGFYLDDPATLRAQVKQMLEAAKPPEVHGELIALLAPHAGHEYSGPVAAHAFKLLEGKQYDTVVLVGLSHRAPCRDVALTEADVWRTPLGDIEVDAELAEALDEASDRIDRDRRPHAQEHCLEVELPFLQQALGEFKIVPLVTQYESYPDCLAFAETLATQIGAASESKRILLVASTDLAHFPPDKECQKTDRRTLDAIVSLDPHKLVAANGQLMSANIVNLSCTVCAFGATLTTMIAAKKLGADQAIELAYCTSATTHPELADRCVGYGAVAFVRTATAGDERDARDEGDEAELSRDEQIAALKLARDTLQKLFANENIERAPLEEGSGLARPLAAFVTLTNKGQLRGCIGSLEGNMPLAHCVQMRAVYAATRDSRFAANPVTKDELPELDIEISVLSPMRLIDDPEKIVVGTHGVMVRQGQRSGLYLPQVAPAQGWDREEMLNSLCAHKAGLAEDAWKKGAELFVFTAQHFSESELGLR